MKKLRTSIATLILVTMLILTVYVPLLSSGVDADGPIEVTDGMGNVHTFDHVPSKMVTIGLGLTATAIELDLLDRLIVCDKFSYLDGHGLFDGVRAGVDAGLIRANGSAYSTGLESVKIDIWYATEQYSLNQGREVEDVAIFLTGTKANLDELSQLLNAQEYHYRHILCWDDIDSYESLIDMVSVMSLVMKGSIDEKIEEMKEIVSYIETKLSGMGDVGRHKAFYVTYSGGELKVGNIGSLANSMITAAGGESITVDPSKASTYATSITHLLERHGSDVVIFVDDVLASNASNMDTLRKSLAGHDVKLVPLDPLWNNYCIESMNGVWTMASAMYPELFEGDVPVLSNDYSEDILLFAIVGIVGSLSIASLSYVYFKK